MFARWVVLTVKTGKKIEVLEAVRKEILPILRKYSGLLGVIPLEPFDEPLKVYVMSLWEDRRSAEKYETESFAAVTHILEPFLVLPPVVKHCTVEETITMVTSLTASKTKNPHFTEVCMIARFVEINIKLDRKAEIIKKVKEEILPILGKYDGFFDLIPLDVETDPTKFYAISLWHEKADMEKYTREHFPKIRAMMEPFLTGPIIVKHCTIDETIPKKFLAAAVA